jgi:hypothetical protein
MARQAVPSLFPVPDTVLSLRLQMQERNADYATSYPHLVKAVNGQAIDATVYVQITHMVYGWMPTVLKLRSSSSSTSRFAAEAAILERVRQGADVGDNDWAPLQKSINNSIVGLSKLLHFLRPDRYAIWDSKVYAYLRSVADPQWNRKVDHEQVNMLSLYLDYMEAMRAFVAKPEFQPVHQHVNNIYGYNVSALRAAEVLMYANAPSPDNKKP